MIQRWLILVSVSYIVLAIVIVDILGKLILQNQLMITNVQNLAPNDINGTFWLHFSIVKGVNGDLLVPSSSFSVCVYLNVHRKKKRIGFSYCNSIILQLK